MISVPSGYVLDVTHHHVMVDEDNSGTLAPRQTGTSTFRLEHERQVWQGGLHVDFTINGDTAKCLRVVRAVLQAMELEAHP